MTAGIVGAAPFDLVVFGGVGDLAYRKRHPTLRRRETSERLSGPTSRSEEFE